MKSLMAGLTLTFLSILAAMAILRIRTPSASSAAGASRTPVVVELFSSEGCSSCPPADTLLIRMAEQQPVENIEVIALEEHVDYWNELGWVDPFSSHDWTARQNVYAAVLKNGNPYTPQMVIDGSTEFIGGQSRKARQLISDSARTEKTQVTLVQQNGNNAGVESLSVKIGKLPVDKQHD